MADTERKWYDYLLNPTEEEKLEIKEKLDQAFKVHRGIEKFGYGEFLEKVVEEKQLKEGKSPEEIVEAKEQTRTYLKDLKNEEISSSLHQVPRLIHYTDPKICLNGTITRNLGILANIRSPEVFNQRCTVAVSGP